jgi:hypothetical protein
VKKLSLSILTLLTGAALSLPLAAQVQHPAAGTSATKHAVKKKHAEKHTAKKKPGHKTKKGVPHKSKNGGPHKTAKAAKTVKTQIPAQIPVEQLTDAELRTAQQIYTGTFPCEQGERVTVTADEAHPGFFSVISGKRHYYMHPVESRTGATRMEDDRHGAVWLELKSKSMLMDQNSGQRVADDCQTTAQRNYAAYMQNHPQHQLLNISTSSQQSPQSPASATGTPQPVASAVDNLQSPVSAASTPLIPASAASSPQPPASVANAPAEFDAPSFGG